MPHLRSTEAYYRRADRWLSRVQERIFFSWMLHDREVGETVVTPEHQDYSYRFLAETFGIITDPVLRKEPGDVLSQGLKQCR